MDLLEIEVDVNDKNDEDYTPFGKKRSTSTTRLQSKGKENKFSRKNAKH